jgi:hypothetical protein
MLQFLSFFSFSLFFFPFSFSFLFLFLFLFLSFSLFFLTHLLGPTLYICCKWSSACYSPCSWPSSCQIPNNGHSLCMWKCFFLLCSPRISRLFATQTPNPSMGALAWIYLDCILSICIDASYHGSLFFTL